MADSTLALAGVFQAAALVKQVACEGRIAEDAFETSIHSIFEVNPETTEAVFGGRLKLASGLRIVCEQFGDGDKKGHLDITKYVISIMHLERKLAKHPELLGTLAEGIERVRGQAAHFSPTHGNVIAALADLYVNTISTLTPRIMVQGEHGYLSAPANANKVRVLLLAAMRAAVLWRQCGGSRWQLIFRRRQVYNAAKQLLTV
ncbi:MAG: high frequency lysogenization protein HflD [Gammaproteobacteria bacterium]